MALKSLKGKNITWHYITEFGDEELAFLKKNYKFHPLDLKDCAGEIQRTKLDTYKNYFFLVLQLPHMDNSNQRVGINQVYFFVGKNYIITISRERIKSLNNFFYKAAKSQKFKETVLSSDPGFLLYRIMDSVLRSGWSVHASVESNLKRIEERLDTGTGKKLVLEIADWRRVILQLKAILDPQRLVIHSLSRIKAEYLNKDINLYFDDLDDFVEKNWFILESYKERILSLQEINESLISFRTTQVMKVLTIFSVAFLPLTLLSGIFGMNIPLPFSHEPRVVWIMFGGLALALTFTFIYLKKSDWI